MYLSNTKRTENKRQKINNRLLWKKNVNCESIILLILGFAEENWKDYRQADRGRHLLQGEREALNEIHKPGFQCF